MAPDEVNWRSFFVFWSSGNVWRTKIFRARLRKFGKNSFASPKIYLLLHLWLLPKQYVGGRGISSPLKVLICRKSRNIRAQMFQHLCSICLMNETDWWKTSEFDILSPKKENVKIYFGRRTENMVHFLWPPKEKVFIIFVKVCRTNIVWASLWKFVQKSFAPPSICLLLHHECYAWRVVNFNLKLWKCDVSAFFISLIS